MTIFTEKKFENFVSLNRQNLPYKTEVILQELNELPFYKNRKRMAEIMTEQTFRLKMKDPDRIECYLPEYNLIQYSKFGWLQRTAEINKEHDFFFWMDAGCSRFFLDTDLSKKWPDVSSLNKEKFVIQRNTNFLKMWKDLNIDEYIWDSRCMLIGTLFGGGRETVYKMKEIIDDICQVKFFQNNCINNEQFALAIASRTYTDLFDIRKQAFGKEQEGASHLPLFKQLSFYEEK